MSTNRPTLSNDDIEDLRDVQRAKVGKYHPGMRSAVLEGYLDLGRSRFGEYVKITEAGKELLAKTGSDAGKTPRGAVPRTSRNTAKQAVGVPPSASVTSPQPPVMPLQAGAISSEPPPGPPPVVTVAQSTRGRPRAADSKQRETITPTVMVSATLTANAVRVIIGRRVWYYPLTSYDKLAHATKQRVLTSNGLYRSYPVAASDQDRIVR